MFNNWSVSRRSSIFLTGLGGLVLGSLLILLWPSVGSSLLVTQGLDFKGRLQAFEPHGHCYLWMKPLLWLHAGSDFSIGAAYVAISLTLVYMVVRSRRDVPFHWVFLSFGTFIIACGATHLMEVWITFFTPVYWLAGYIKLITALASVFTALVLPSIVPRALHVIEAARVSNERRIQLEGANLELETLYARSRENEAALQRAHDELESRVLQRTAALAQANDELQKNSDRLRAIMDNTTAMIYLKDNEGRYLLLNRQFQETFGEGRGELVGKTAQDIFPTVLASVLEENDRRVRATDHPLVVDEEVLHPDGIHTYVTTKVALRNAQGEPYAICGISTDITEHKRTQSELQLAKEEAERANAAKNEFLSRMSHELRTPLNAIIGFGQLMEMESQQLPARRQQDVQHILKAGHHLLGLVDEVLDITRLEAPDTSLPMEAVNLNDVINEAADMVQTLAVSAEVSVVPQPSATPLWVEANRQRLLQILLNLLSNAIKYNKTGGSVTVSSQLSSNNRVSFHVTDTGYGIAAEDMAQLFVPFSRLNAESLGVEGTGLGLVLCQNLVRAMNGSLDVKSQLGQGSTFSVELMRAQPQEAAANRDAPAPTTPTTPKPTTPSSASSKPTVLLIEDNISNFELIEAILSNLSNVRLIGAMQGTLGVDLARQQRPDLILLDLHLPDMMGDEVLRRLQSFPETRDVPVVVLSADAMPAQIEALLAQGARRYLTKPLNVKQFLQAVNETIESRSF